MAQVIQQMPPTRDHPDLKNADHRHGHRGAVRQLRGTGAVSPASRRSRPAAAGAFYYSTSTGNNGKAGNKRVDGLLDELRTAAGQARKAEIYAELQEALTEWLPIGPLVAHRNGWYVRSSVAGFPGNRVGASNPDWALVWAKA